jgi:hypothetical protein
MDQVSKIFSIHMEFAIDPDTGLCHLYSIPAPLAGLGYKVATPRANAPRARDVLRAGLFEIVKKDRGHAFAPAGTITRALTRDFGWVELRSTHPMRVILDSILDGCRLAEQTQRRKMQQLQLELCTKRLALDPSYRKNRRA